MCVEESRVCERVYIIRPARVIGRPSVDDERDGKYDERTSRPVTRSTTRQTDRPWYENYSIGEKLHSFEKQPGRSAGDKVHFFIAERERERCWHSVHPRHRQAIFDEPKKSICVHISCFVCVLDEHSYFLCFPCISRNTKLYS